LWGDATERLVVLVFVLEEVDHQDRMIWRPQRRCVCDEGNAGPVIVLRHRLPNVLPARILEAAITD
jgi:hypothetical protein